MTTPPEGLRTLTCPSCGAPLEIDIHEPTIQCQYCNTSFENPKYREPEPEIPETPSIHIEVSRPVYFPPQPVPMVQPAPKKTSGCVGGIAVLIALILTLGIGAGVFLFYAASPGAKPISINIPPAFPLQIRAPAVLLPADGVAPNVIAVTYDPVKSNYTLSRLDLETRKVVWSTLDQSDYLSVDALVPGDRLVYVVVSNRLIALQLSDGKQAWEASLPDELYSAGVDPVVIIKGQVVVLTTDNSLGAYDALTGHQTWEKRYESTGWRLYPLEDSLALTYSTEVGAAVGVVDAGSGEEMTHIEPTCQAEGSIMTDELAFYSNIVIDDFQRPAIVYTFFGLFNACVQRWNLDSGVQEWEYLEPNQNLDNSNDIPVLLAQGHLYYIQDKQLRSLDTTSATDHRVIDEEKDYELIPIFVTGDHLVVRAKRTRGTARYELWGYDLVSGRNLWKNILMNSEPVDPPGRMAGIIDSDSTGWSVQLTPDGLWLITFQVDPMQASIVQVNLDTGGMGNLKSAALGIESSTNILDVPKRIKSSDHLAWYQMENRLYALDPLSGSIKYRWP